ncbi:hypothetical protein [Lactobacillus sp. LL6]|uniref:hypothetical protein n=1 Tax=Lactobacillus sp. LL6 TaxID=2596827 RepID=UPI001184E7CE|nr:hypothetical protein [Lactobacillus sp. LL6]TSO26966.1 hypothetical protein FOD82_08070 [Lactobacillus sp. LL6]
MLFSKKKIVAKSVAALGLALTLGGTAVASASSWTITEVNVGAGGSWSSYGDPNLKTTNSNVASFNGDALPAVLGYNVRLINSHASGRSSWVGLYKDRTTHADNNSGKRNYYYYSDVRSQTFEPNETRVKLHFSSDRK